MLDIVGICYRFVGDLLHSFMAKWKGSPQLTKNEPLTELHHTTQLDDLAAKALTAVFGMDAEGRIKKEKARLVVEKLGLIGGDEDGVGFDLLGELEDELRADEIVGTTEDGLRQAELIHQAFMVFDKDGDGFIEASEVKGVLECLGLAKGWEMGEFERMVAVVDLNFDGKVDFSEFQLMMT